MNMETEGYVHPTGGETTIYLIRHGQTMANSLSKYAGSWDVELNDIGRRQAKLLAVCLRETPFDAMVTSNLSRVQDTAREILGFHSHIRLEEDPDFAEWNFGKLEGKEFASLVVDYPELARQLKDPDGSSVTWPGGESSDQFNLRLRRGFCRLLTDHDHQRVALVTHGGVISMLMLLLTGLHRREDYFRMSPSNCSITEVQITGTRSTVVRWNDVQHLESEGIHHDPFVSPVEAKDKRSRGERL